MIQPEDEATLPSRLQAPVKHRSISEVFYTQDNISGRFHNGREVCAENVKWPMVITQYKSQWFTLNNRTLFAYRKSLWGPNSRGVYPRINLVDMEVPVKVVPFEDVKIIFHQKYTTTTNGNECYIRGRNGQTDCTCAPLVNRSAYYKFVLRQDDPDKEKYYLYHIGNLEPGRDWSDDDCVLRQNDPDKEPYSEFVLKQRKELWPEVFLAIIMTIFFVRLIYSESIQNNNMDGELQAEL